MRYVASFRYGMLSLYSTDKSRWAQTRDKHAPGASRVVAVEWAERVDAPWQATDDVVNEAF